MRGKNQEYHRDYHANVWGRNRNSANHYAFLKCWPKLHLQDLSFSWRCLWGFRSSGLWRCAVGRDPDVSEQRSAMIF